MCIRSCISQLCEQGHLTKLRDELLQKQGRDPQVGASRVGRAAGAMMQLKVHQRGELHYFLACIKYKCIIYRGVEGSAGVLWSLCLSHDMDCVGTTQSMLWGRQSVHTVFPHKLYVHAGMPPCLSGDTYAKQSLLTRAHDAQGVFTIVIQHHMLWLRSCVLSQLKWCVLSQQSASKMESAAAMSSSSNQLATGPDYYCNEVVCGQRYDPHAAALGRLKRRLMQACYKSSASLNY